jgi:NAD(P)-dependent dehydrogenase (short-subunit alcohol dehydrogenase family)
VESVACYYGRRGVRANAVAPGGVNTGMDTAFRSSYAQEMTAPAIAAGTTVLAVMLSAAQRRQASTA